MTFREFMKENDYELQTILDLQVFRTPSTVRLKNGKIIVSISRS